MKRKTNLFYFITIINANLFLAFILFFNTYLSFGLNNSLNEKDINMNHVPLLLASMPNPTATPEPFSNAECKANCALGGIIGAGVCTGGTLLFVATMPAIHFTYTLCTIGATWGVISCNGWCDNNYPN